jgi:hypothetical protein
MIICNQAKDCTASECYHKVPHDPVADAVLARISGEEDATDLFILRNSECKKPWPCSSITRLVPPKENICVEI